MFQIIHEYMFPESKMESSEPSEPTNFYYFALKRPDEKSDWSIHGLWPQTTIEKYPAYCKKITFDLNKLSPIIDKLNKYWYSETSSHEDPNETFWKHEWEKHGSCMYNNCDEYDYFNTAIKLFESVKDNDELIKKYQKNNTSVMIPYNQEFDIIQKL